MKMKKKLDSVGAPIPGAPGPANVSIEGIGWPAHTVAKRGDPYPTLQSTKNRK